MISTRFALPIFQRSGAIKYIVVVGVCLTIAALSVSGGQGTPNEKSPKEVVEEFWKLETEGGRLTPEGWLNADIFFVRPEPLPRKKIIEVISAKYKYSVDVRWIKG